MIDIDIEIVMNVTVNAAAAAAAAAAAVVCCVGSSVTCIHNATSYADGDAWTSDECDSCICRDGLSFCEPVDCPPLTDCGWVAHVEGLCCPVCKGNVFVIYTWQMQ